MLLSKIGKKMLPSLINCEFSVEIWNQITSLYGESSEDAKQGA